MIHWLPNSKRRSNGSEKCSIKIKKFFGFGDDGSLSIDAPSADRESDEKETPFNPTGSLTGGGLISTTTKAGNLKSGISGMSNTAPKQFNINIDKLIDNFTISTERIEQSRDQIRDIVLETLLTAVNDVQSSVE